MRKCCFAGHSNISNQEEIKIRLKNEIINLVEKENVTEFYNGYKGAFDSLCARTVNELKKDYPFIKSYLVRAYMPKEKDSYEEDLYKQIFDSTIYPEIENVPRRLAILKRNEWMIDNSNFLIAYVKYDGGALKTLKYGERRNIEIINIAEVD